MKDLKVKFDIREMTEHWNNCVEYFGEDINNGKVMTPEQMSEKIQRHAHKLNVFWGVRGVEEIKHTTSPYICLDTYIFYKRNITELNSLPSRYKKMGLEFFSIAPEPKMVTVRMSEDSYKAMTGVPITESWKLIK